jgi:hypothetical protein
MDVFDLSSQEECSPLKPLAKRPRNCLNNTTDTQDVETSVSCGVVLSDKPVVKTAEKNDVIDDLEDDDVIEDCIKTDVSTVNANLENAADKIDIPCTNDLDMNSADICDREEMERDVRKPVYIYDQELVRRCDCMPKIICRVGLGV